MEAATVQVWLGPSGLLSHSPDGWCAEASGHRLGQRSFGAAGYGRRSEALPASPVSVLELSGGGVCEQCGPRLVVPPVGSRSRPLAPFAALVAFLQDAGAAQAVERFLAKPGGKAGKLEKLREELVTASRKAEARAALGVSPGLEVLESKLREDLARLERLLLERTAGADHRDRLAALLRAELLPSRSQARVTLDESPTLAGFVGFHASARRVSEVVAAFRVGGSPSSPVLFAPRFVLDWLFRFYAVGSTWGSTVLVAHPAPVERSVAETAAGLWDPSAPGAMHDLAEALRAARLLCESPEPDAAPGV